MSDVLSFNDDEITKAFVKPDAPAIVDKIFSFIQDNDNHVTVAGGMTHHVTGLDRDKLLSIASRGYGIDLSRWMFAVDIYEEGLLNRQRDMQDT